jgi:hypothetical protein
LTARIARFDTAVVAGGAVPSQPSWTGWGTIELGSDLNPADACGLALAVAAGNLALFVAITVVAQGLARVGVLAAVTAVVGAIVWWRWRPALGVVLVVQSLALLVAASSVS